MRILTTASRTWTNIDFIKEILTTYQKTYPGATVVHGACPRGGDKHVDQLAPQLGFAVERHPADWDIYGKAAGFVRNAHMVNLGADVCLAFITAGSKGASMCADLAENEGIVTRRFVQDGPDQEPKELV